MAVAVACFERAMTELGAFTPELARLLEVLWQFPAAADLGAWDHDLRYAAAPGLAHRTTVEGASDVIWAGIDPRLRQMYEDVEEVGTGNLYGATRSQFTLRPLLRVVAAARALGVEVPPADALGADNTSWDDEAGWGRAINDARARLLGSA